MASLFNTRISDTYSGLIKTIDNAAITASLKELTDGNGNSTSIYLNNAGDFKVTAILEFGSLKDTGENIIISKFVDAADGIGNNDNDTTIPTTAAIIDYVAAQITIEDLDFTGDTGSGQIDLDSQIFAIGGTTNEITTVASGQSITFSLDSTGVYLPDNSTAITQTAGDNSTKIATTSYVDTLDAASDLDFSGDSGTGDVNLNTQTFAITGTTNQIESSASNQGLSLQFPSAGVTLPNGSVATTQSSSDDSTKVATTAYVKGLNNASDLDFITDSGSGAVVLNSETLSVVGTTNEIETSGSGQEIQIGLPSSISTNLVGNVTGNLTGNVVGDLTGNADTATAWETARDLSLTGQATGTISSVDGTNNVSGAVTLDNNSVTGKVLTGLTSPSASSVLATDTIVEGFGKLQSQVNGLAGGLRFMGSWDADTNSPVLSSGGGEAANGTTTATTANKLVDSSASFTSTVTVGDQVVNQVDGQTALVSNVDSDTTLSLDADIMLTGEAYTIDNSPFITQGHYYVVSVGGTTTLNGVSNWTIGDWVIAGANNQWTKLDHSQVDGTGTTGNLTKWSSTSVIADSIVSESGSAITVDGSLSTNTNLSSTGNFAVNTDKFTVAASSGNTNIAGTTIINDTLYLTEYIQHLGNTGNNIRFTTDAIAISANATFGGSVTTGNDIFVAQNKGIFFNGASDFSSGIAGTSAGQGVRIFAGGSAKVTIDSSGNSTFAGDINVTGNTITVDPASGDATLLLQTSTQTLSVDQNSIRTTTNNNLAFLTNNTLALTLDTSQNSTFAGRVDISAVNDTYNLKVFGGDTDSWFGVFDDANNSANIILTRSNGDEVFKIMGHTQVATFGGTITSGALSVGSTGTSRFTDTNAYPLQINRGLDVDVYGANGAFLSMGSIKAGTYIDAVRMSGGLAANGTDGNYYIQTLGGGSYTTALTINSVQDANFTGKVTAQSTASNTAGQFAFSTGGNDVGIREDTSGGFNIDVYKSGIGYINPLTIDSSGNVNVTSGRVRIAAGGSDEGTQLNLWSDSDGHCYIAGFDLEFKTGSNNARTTKMRIDSSGNLTIGNFTPGNPSRLNVRGSGSYNTTFSRPGATVQIISDELTNDTWSPVLNIANIRQSLTTGKDSFGGIGFSSIDDSNNAGVFDAARIALINEQPSSVTSPTSLAFYTNIATTQSFAATERMRITSDGVVGIGTDSPRAVGSGYTGLEVSSASSGSSVWLSGFSDSTKGYLAMDTGGLNLTAISNHSLIFGTNNSEKMRITSAGRVFVNNNTYSRDALMHIEGNSTNYALYLYAPVQYAGIYRYQRFWSGNNIAGGIDGSNQTSVQYVTTSDYRTKKNIKPLENGLDRVCKLKPVKFDWKLNNETTEGFIAHEVQDIFPEAVSGEKDGQEMQGMDYGRITPLLVKAIQELKAEVDLLKQECKCKN